MRQDVYLSSSASRWGCLCLIRNAGCRSMASMSSVFLLRLFGESPATRMKICVIIPRSRCGFRFPLIPAHWEQPPTGSFANTRFPMTRWLKLNTGFGWKRGSPFTCIGPMDPMDHSSVSCARFCPSITRMRSIPCVIRLRCTWAPGLSSTSTPSGLKGLFMKNGPCRALTGSFPTHPWCPARNICVIA